tara:strand:+ start:741 stop:1166 length:426 start_codon:yes stop_codon:yes gene_type:complete
MLRYSFLICLCALISGCGGDENSLQLYGVTGKVTKAGSPMSDVQVKLVPRSTTKAPLLIGRTVEDGTFEIIAPGGKKGAPVGDYKVVLTPNTEMSTDDYSSGNAPKTDSSEIPQTYQSAETTEASLTVSADADNTITIEIP